MEIEISFEERMNEAAVRFLKRRGLDIIDRAVGENLSLAARDGDALVFVSVDGRRSDQDYSLPDDPPSIERRKQAEAEAARWIEQNADSVEPDIPVRFDTVSILVLGVDRALLRHHISAFSQAA